MITAIDSSILLDILTADTRFLRRSQNALEVQSLAGRLIVSSIVLAEIFPLLRSELRITQFLEDLALEFVDLGFEASILAGGIYDMYRKNKGPRSRVMSDFLVGAHALIHSDGLLTRDKGFYRPYFKNLKIIDPLMI